MYYHLIGVFDTAYYIAKNNKPLGDMEALLKYAKILGVNVLEQYKGNNQCK